jgi:hypothetical protein
MLFGCSPDIKIAPLSDTEPGDPINYQVHIDPEGNKLVDVNISYFPKYRHPNEPVPLAPQYREQENLWVGEIPPQPPGEYRLLVKVTYRSPLGILSLGHTTSDAVSDVVVHPALSNDCFTFDNKSEALEGWQASAVFDGESDAQYSKGNCPDLLFLNRSWPFGLDRTTAGGSLFIPVAPSCFPKTSTEVARHGQWRFDLVSPDLSQRKPWQSARGIRYRFATQTIPVKLKTLVRFRYEDQTITHTLAPPQSDDNTVDAIPGNWRIVDVPFDLPQGAVLENVLIRVLGQPERTVTPDVASLFLDGVCPLSGSNPQ